MDLSSYTALLGGSFNPPHIGHFRIAQELAEFCNPAQLLFVPNVIPPHKSTLQLLPYNMRESMLQSGIAGKKNMYVSSIELEQQGPSYTIDTLRSFHQKGLSRLLFVMGLDNLPQLPTWKEWESLPEFAEIVVLPRTCRVNNVMELVKPLWPEATVDFEESNGHMRITLEKRHKLWYIPQPVLEISASLIRSRWLEGRSIDYLVPNSVQDFLQANSSVVRSIWSNQV